MAAAATLAVLASVAAHGSSPYPDVADDAYYSDAVESLDRDGVFADTGCDDGFCPDEALDRATMAVWTVRVLDGSDPAPAASTRFGDVDASHPHAALIERFAELGITRGCGDGTRFCPDDTVTRAQMAVFLSRAFDLEDGPDPGFGDVAPDAWYAPSVHKLAASGITRGCGDGARFCPDDTVTRAQMALFLLRAQETARTTAPTAPPGAATYKAVAGSCGLLTDGTISCWADTFFTAIVSPGGTYKSLVTGGSYYCAIAADATITCWGEDWRGETDPPAGTYETLSAGGLHACAIATDGAITCWGDNRDGQTDAPPGTYKSLAAGNDHNCAIATDGAITCWGDNLNGKADAPPGAYTTVVAGRGHNCAIATDGTITCWGAACGTQAGGGYGCTWMNRAPAGTHKDLVAGANHSCAIATDGTMTCWGNNWDGKADAPAGTYKSVVAGRAHSCAIATDGTIACWGDNEHGQTDAPAGTYRSLAIGGVHSCAIAIDGTITCWGYNEGGQADPPKTAVEVAATQALDPLDLSGRSMADFVSSDVPAFDMIDVATGDTVNLRSVVHGRTPILLWRYSPY